jgi:hypothetical protein
MFIRPIALAALVTGIASAANAGVVFSDNFNSYAFQLDWVPPSNWIDVGPGTVDLIGETKTGSHFDLYHGDGGYVDLAGSNGIAGRLETTKSFGP